MERFKPKVTPLLCQESVLHSHGIYSPCRPARDDQKYFCQIHESATVFGPRACGVRYIWSVFKLMLVGLLARLCEFSR
jgi:hypothetical protein